jgi:hypothetical protein
LLESRRLRFPAPQPHRAAELGLKVKIGCHTFRATGITACLEAGGNADRSLGEFAFRSNHRQMRNAMFDLLIAAL